MRPVNNDYSGLRSGPILREAGVGGSNPLTPTNKSETPDASRSNHLQQHPLRFGAWLCRINSWIAAQPSRTVRPEDVPSNPQFFVGRVREGRARL